MNATTAAHATPLVIAVRLYARSTQGAAAVRATWPLTTCPRAGAPLLKGALRVAGPWRDEVLHTTGMSSRQMVRGLGLCSSPCPVSY